MDKTLGSFAMTLSLLLSPPVFGWAAPAKEEISSVDSCEPPPESQWHLSLEGLTKKTRNIVIAKVIGEKHSGFPPTLKPDFKLKGGLAIHGRRDAKGKRKSQNDDIWNSSKWDFEISEVLKGPLKVREKLSFISLNKSPDITTTLTNPLCEFPLSFVMGKSYLIFVDSYNPQGYRELPEGNTTMVEEVRALIDKQKSKK